MTKQLFTATLAFFYVIASHAQDITPPTANKAVVYFARVSSYGFAINFTYFDSAMVIGKANGTHYIRYECEPGQHLFWARSENRDFIEADLEAGRIYILEALPQMGAIKAGLKLRAIDPSKPKMMKGFLKLIKKKSAETFSSEELARMTADFKEVIARGLEKYHDDKERGKRVDVLEKTMYYQAAAE